MERIKKRNVSGKHIRLVKAAGLLCMAVLLLCLCACGGESESSFPTATDRFFVNDFAGVLDSTAADEIYSRGAALNEKTTAQVVAVTVESVDGAEMSDYALELGRKWGIGTSEKNNGVLILLSTGDRQVYIAVGYGLEGALPDSKTGRILDHYGVGYFKNDQWSEGMLSVYKAVANEVYLEYGLAADSGYVPADQLSGGQTVEEYESGYTKKVGLSWIAMIVVIVLYVAFFRRRGRGLFWFGGPFGGGGFSGGSGGFSGGGFSGGGFSGGGGSFGGGGAGRGF